MEEIWKDINGYEGFYQVSNLGRIKSLKRKADIHLSKRTVNTRILTPYQKEYGYYAVKLSKNGIRKGFLVHRLVAKAFIKNPFNYDQVNHKDENTRNNVVSNLEWCSPKYNNNYGKHNKRISKTQMKAVLQVDSKGNIIRKFNSVQQAADFVKRKPVGVSRAAKSNQKYTCGGYFWMYALKNNANGAGNTDGKIQ